MNKNTRVNNPQPNNMKPHGNQATRCNCPSCTSFIPHPGSLGHRNPQDVQDTIDYQWHLLKAQPDLKRFLLENPPELSLRKLVDYWSHPKRIVNARNGGEIVSVTSGGSLFLALHYLFLGKVAEARALLMNGAFLGQCFVSPTCYFFLFYVFYITHESHFSILSNALFTLAQTN